MSGKNLHHPRARWRAANPMAEHDRLPPEARAWAASAALPWSASSIRRLWARALRDTGTPEAAIRRLAAAEAATLTRDAARVWGPGYPLSVAPSQTADRAV